MKLIDKAEFINKLIHRQWNIVDDTGNHDDAIRIDEIGKIIDMLDNEETVKAIPNDWLKKCKASDMTCAELTGIDKPYVHDIIVMLIDEYEEYMRWKG